MTMENMKGAGYNIDDQILCEILSRLPLKSLIRFKCVCKSWEFLIEKDKWLINLHHSRASPRLLMTLFPHDESLRDLVKFESYWTANLCIDTNHEEITTATAIEAAITNKDLLVCKQVLEPINGVICLIDKIECDYGSFDEVKEDHAACLYNVITQEATPWIRSTYLEEVERWCDLSNVNVSRTYEFGFDPTTREYKVICMWSISGWDLQKFEGCGEYILVDNRNEGYYQMCEILTLGKDTVWRRLDKVPPSDKHSKAYCGSVYANGSIYWIIYRDGHDLLVAFDVGTEEYRVIEYLDSIGDGEYLDVMDLMELDGCLAIVEDMGDGTFTLWILDDDCDKNNSAKNTSNIEWTKEIIMLPHDWCYESVTFHALAGTEYLILECYFGGTIRPVFVHSYNRKTKTFSEDESISSSLGSYDHPLCMFTTYSESLLTHIRYRPALEAPDLEINQQRANF